MEGKGHHDLRWCTMSPWILLIILIMLPYSVSACDRDSCAQCSSNGNSCNVCNDGYYLYYSHCYQCPESICVTCSSTYTCTGCIDGYYLKSGRCYQCQDSNCVTCSSAYTCTGCNDGYYLNSGNCNQCQVSNCVICSSTYTCTGCIDGYYLNGGRCYQCQDSNCVTCSSTYTCTGCIDGYYLNGGRCYQCPESNCVTCSSAYTCTGCNDGYYLNSGNCYQCQDSNCVTCSSTYTCTGCNDGYYLNSGNCNQCQDSNCVTCSSAYTCTGCIDGYYLNGGRCYQCQDSNCVTCSSTYTCTGCIDGYYLNGGRCYQCPESNCVTCSSAYTCTGCNDGYYLNSGNCYQCQDSNCVTCSSTYTCTGCNDGYYLNSGNCNQCQDSNCVTCSSAYTCTGCIDGYYLNSGRCYQCQDSNCVTCSSAYTCTGCNDGYYLNSGRCNQCQDSNCVTCSSAYTCTGCNDGYYLISGNCNQCQDSNCVTCSSAYTCTGCNDGYYLISGNCNQCQDSNCVTCSSAYTCTGCNDGYFLNSGNCNQCQDSNCVTCSSTYTCTGCNDGYYLNSGNCNQCQDSNCVTCSSAYTCTGCNDGFYLNSGNCNQCQDSSCVTCSSAYTCTGCNDGYYLNSGNCNQCQDSNCVTCSSAYTCTGCIDGYYLLDGSCFQCQQVLPHCASCRNSSFCTKSTTPNTTTTSSSDTQYKRQDPNESDTMKPTTSTFTQQPDEPQADSRAHKADDSSSTVIGAATGGGAVIVIAIIVILFVCFIKRRSKGSNQDQMENPMQAQSNVGSDYPVYAMPCKPINSNIQPAEDYLYAIPNKHKHGSRKHTKSEIDEPQRVSFRNVMVDLDVELVTTAETDVDAVQLEIVDGDGVTTDIDMGESIPSSDTYYNMEGLIRSQVKVTQLFDYVKQKTDYDKEFKKLLKGLQRSCNEALKPNNRHRNRYNGIYAYDATRVVLHTGTYINANYIDGHNKAQEYIASLGPTASAMNDYETFWEMVWQHNVETIVMLTKLDEGVKMKCEQYWPNSGEVMTSGQYILEGVSEKIFADFVIREIAVRNADTSDKRHVTQYQYTAWPDRSVPDSVVSLVAFRDKVEQQNMNRTSPIVVHCSAGIGRTGTYIALDFLLQQARDDTYIDIFGCAIGLRGQRVNMIQTEQQYEYLHHCVLYVITCNTAPIKEVNLKGSVSDEEISIQYNALKALESIKRRWSLASTKRNRNQTGSTHLDDRYRVHLMSSKDNAVNAVYINSYLRQNRFIISQTPLSSNLQDFITMIYQEKCHVIVCLDDNSAHDKNVGKYIPPDNKTIKIGPYQVKCTSNNVMDEYTVRNLVLSHSTSGQQLDIRHYQIRGWNSKDMVPSNSILFLKFVQEFNNKNSKIQEVCPILIHCQTGADRSGLFCGVSTMLETLTVEKQISIVHIVYHIRERCHTAFKTYETFKFCYDCVKDFLNRVDGNKLYYNVNAFRR